MAENHGAFYPTEVQLKRTEVLARSRKPAMRSHTNVLGTTERVRRRSGISPVISFRALLAVRANGGITRTVLPMPTGRAALAEREAALRRATAEAPAGP